jgi:hypothetical protein
MAVPSRVIVGFDARASQTCAAAGRVRMRRAASGSGSSFSRGVFASSGCPGTDPDTMSEELHELHEHVEAGHHDPSLAPVSITMAILAVLVAVVSLLGHRAHTEELLSQNRASDAWAEYQAQSIRFHSYQQFLDQLSISDTRDSLLIGKLRTKYKAGVEHYQNRRSESSATARQFESEVKIATRRADRFDLGEVCLEAALVIVSMTLLTRKRVYWSFGSALAIAGLIIAGTGFLIR